ncbi:MAG: hypothetical protein GX593_05395 [Actinomycetales bacterium]|nr:hypothetical protein [Actinomycetales bacterium]
MTVETIWGGESVPWVPVPLVWTDPTGQDLLNFAADAAHSPASRKPDGFKLGRYVSRFPGYLAAFEGRELSSLFLWLGELCEPPVFLTLAVYDAVGSAEETLPLLGHVDDPGLGVEVTPAPHPHLGEGARYVRRVKVRKGLFGSSEQVEVRWVWRTRGAKDHLLTLERRDQAELDRILPDVEALIATARLSG